MKNVRTALVSIGSSVVLCLGFSANVLAQATGGPAISKGTGARGLVQIQGEIVCVGCNLTEAERRFPDRHDLYMFENDQGEMVLSVNTVNNSANRGRSEDITGRWVDIAWPPRLWVRAEEEVFDRLLAKRNISKPVQITGILHSTRTLDVMNVKIDRGID